MAAPDALAPAAASAHAEVAVPLATGRSLWRRLLGHKLFVTGIILFGIVLAMALFADVLATAAPSALASPTARSVTPSGMGLGWLLVAPWPPGLRTTWSTAMKLVYWVSRL